jgi:subtilisin family serine protease
MSSIAPDAAMSPSPDMELLAMVGLPPLMETGEGSLDVAIALIDGPVLAVHPALETSNIVAVRAGAFASIDGPLGPAARHGTSIAGILSAKRGSVAPAICPGCRLLVRPIFTDGPPEQVPHAHWGDLAEAIHECLAAGASVINLSTAFEQPSLRRWAELASALDAAAQRGALVVAAAGNHGQVGGSAIIRHPWVIPVAAYDRRGVPLLLTNLGASIGRHGLGAPGDGVHSVIDDLPVGGTSAATAFVSGALALLRSAFPDATAVEVRQAVLGGPNRRRAGVAPPLLNAWEALRSLSSHGRLA